MSSSFTSIASIRMSLQMSFNVKYRRYRGDRPSKNLVQQVTFTDVSIMHQALYLELRIKKQNKPSLCLQGDHFLIWQTIALWEGGSKNWKHTAALQREHKIKS